MPGLFARAANSLTDLSGYYVDWSRVGELISQTKHHYTWQQLIERGAIVASTAYGAYKGYECAEDSSFGLNASLYSMAGCFVGFVVSHLVVIAPLIYKRHQRKIECDKTNKKIISLFSKLREIDCDNEAITTLITTLGEVVKVALNINLSDEKHARASQTWGRRSALMEKIKIKLNDDFGLLVSSHDREDTLVKLSNFWHQEPSNLFEVLENPSSEKPIFQNPSPLTSRY